MTPLNLWELVELVSEVSLSVSITRCLWSIFCWLDEGWFRGVKPRTRCSRRWTFFFLGKEIWCPHVSSLFDWSPGSRPPTRWDPSPLSGIELCLWLQIRTETVYAFSSTSTREKILLMSSDYSKKSFLTAFCICISAIKNPNSCDRPRRSPWMV